MNMLINLRYRRVIDTLLSFMREINQTCLKLSGLKISALVYAKHLVGSNASPLWSVTTWKRSRPAGC